MVTQDIGIRVKVTLRAQLYAEFADCYLSRLATEFPPHVLIGNETGQHHYWLQAE